MAQTGFTPIVTYHSTTASAVPTAGNLSPGELALNINDMKLYCENSSGVVTLLASAAGSSGDVVGPASSTDNAVVRFDGTTGKLVQNSGVLIADDGTTVISVNSATDALRITQTGAGNALLVEDSANPDATPFVIDAIGKVIVGNTAFITPVTGIAPQIQVQGNTASTSSITAARFSADSSSSNYLFSKSRNTTVGTYGGIVSSGDILGNISFVADDGANPILSAQIQAAVDGTPGTNDMPGRLVFATTADGASTVTERMRIDSAGNVGIGGTAAAGQNLRISKTLTGSTVASGILQTGAIQSDVTSQARYYSALSGTAAASFTLSNLYQFIATQGTFGLGSTVTNQYGFFVESTLTGATNNYGFYSDIASGTGRWNFYANGTAENFFGGVTTFRAANAIRSEAAATQDAVVIAGRAGGTGSFAVTLTPATLSASRTLTLPEPGENVTLGYLNIPQNIESVNYTLVAEDAGKHIFHPSADTTARTWTIPANSSVPYSIGTAITFINQNGAGVITIAITSDTMRLAGAGTTGSRTLAANGIATCIKVTSTEWLISGTGLT